MLPFRLSHLLLLAFIHYVDGQRRIKDGFEVKGDKRYMVYLVQAKSSIRDYDSWVCGGSIVTRWYILTSAACVEDVQSMYAITGTRRYVNSVNIYKDTCTVHTKKKIVFTCVPKEYELDFNKIENWSYNDISIIKVDTPYDFNNDLYDKHCDYRPNAIKINFDLKNEKRGTNVIVLGFGHRNYWRQTHYTEDWNHRSMHYMSSKIYNISKCKNMYKSPDLSNNIDKYMICTNEKGTIDEEGNMLEDSGLGFRRTHNKSNLKMRSTGKNKNITLNIQTRRQGICQNDHGGPLVAWIDEEETVMGVASVFRVNKDRKCTGPYLYTSTARNQMFIECIITDQMTRRKNGCDQPASVKGFSILRRYILWNENEDQNEKASLSNVYNIQEYNRLFTYKATTLEILYKKSL